MAPLRYGSYGAPLNALSAGPIRVEEAVGVVVGVGSGAGRYFDLRYDRAGPHRLPPGGYQPIGEPEGAQSCCVCGVPLRPGRGVPVLL